MLRGTRPTAALAASLVVLTGALSACGSETPGTGLPFADRLDAVTISGDVGDAKIDFKERMSADEVESETTITGTGEALAKDDKLTKSYGALGLPFSVLIDRGGREVARLPRAAEWDQGAYRSLVAKTVRA